MTLGIRLLILYRGSALSIRGHMIIGSVGSERSQLLAGSWGPFRHLLLSESGNLILYTLARHSGGFRELFPVGYVCGFEHRRLPPSWIFPCLSGDAYDIAKTVEDRTSNRVLQIVVEFIYLFPAVTNSSMRFACPECAVNIRSVFATVAFPATVSV